MESQNNQANEGSILRDPTASDSYVTRKVAELIEQEGFRKRTIEIIIEHTDSVPFMEKVQKYADNQIDNRLFKNVKVMTGIIISWVISLGVAILAAWVTAKNTGQ